MITIIISRNCEVDDEEIETLRETLPKLIHLKHAEFSLGY